MIAKAALLVVVLSCSLALAATDPGESVELLNALRRVGESQQAIAGLLRAHSAAWPAGKMPESETVRKAGYEPAVVKALTAKPATRPWNATAFEGNRFGDPSLPVTLVQPKGWVVSRDHPYFAPRILLLPTELPAEATGIETGVFVAAFPPLTAGGTLTKAIEHFEKRWHIEWRTKLQEKIQIRSSRLQLLGDVPAVVYDVGLAHEKTKKVRRAIMAACAADDTPLVLAAVFPPKADATREALLFDILASIRSGAAPKGWKEVVVKGAFSVWVPPEWSSTPAPGRCRLNADDSPQGSEIHITQSPTRVDETAAPAAIMLQWVSAIGETNYLRVSKGPHPLQGVRGAEGQLAVLTGTNPISEAPESYLIGVVKQREKVLYLSAASWQPQRFEAVRKDAEKVLTTLRFELR